MKPILTAIIALIILSVSAIAAENVDFNQSSVSLAGVPGDTVSIDIVVNNTGDEDINTTFSGYELISGSNTLNITELADEQDQIPGEERTITIEIIIPADQIAGSYTGTLIGTTTDGATDSISIEVNVSETSDGLVLITTPTNGETAPGVTHTVLFEVENERNAPITATIGGSLSDSSNSIAITAGTVTIPAFDTVNVSASMDISTDQTANDYTGDIELTYDTATVLAIPYTLTVTLNASFTATVPNVVMRAGEVQNVTITLTKTGNVNLTAINATYVESTFYDNNGDRITVQFFPETVDLTDTTVAMIAQLTASSRMNADDYTSILTFESDDGTTAQASLAVNVESILRIRKVDLTSEGADDELKPGEELTLEIKVENTDEDIDLENVFVTVRFKRGTRYLEDDDGDDIEEESDEVDIDADDDDTFTLTIEMPEEDIDDGDDYVIEVTVEGRNADDRSQIFSAVDESESIEFVKENHEIKFTELVLSPDTIRCSRKTAIDIGVQNIGKKDEDVQVIIKNDDLGLYETRAFELDKDIDDTDNEWEQTVYITPDDDVSQGTYTILVEAYYDDNDEALRESLSLNVEECTSSDYEPNDDVVEDNGDDKDNGIDIITPPIQPPVVPGVSSPSVGDTKLEDKEFTSTGSYLVLLIVLVIALIILVGYLGSVAYRGN